MLYTATVDLNVITLTDTRRWETDNCPLQEQFPTGGSTSINNASWIDVTDVGSTD